MVSMCGVDLTLTSLASACVLVNVAAAIKVNNAVNMIVAATLSLLNVLVVFMIVSFVGCGGWLFVLRC
jgi:hypothetical protein